MKKGRPSQLVSDATSQRQLSAEQFVGHANSCSLSLKQSNLLIMPKSELKMGAVEGVVQFDEAAPK